MFEIQMCIRHTVCRHAAINQRLWLCTRFNKSRAELSSLVVASAMSYVSVFFCTYIYLAIYLYIYKSIHVYRSHTRNFFCSMSAAVAPSRSNLCLYEILRVCVDFFFVCSVRNIRTQIQATFERYLIFSNLPRDIQIFAWKWYLHCNQRTYSTLCHSIFIVLNSIGR